ncbi:hypothetical protein [Salipiger sp.]|uniref:hypothetical protein n=1 Tax=Salipiger sp. TaxID=2078585 RepID=UPI003A987D62
MTMSNVQIGMGRGSLRQKIDMYFVTVGLGVNPYALRRARMRDIIALESKSDSDLAHMGLAREDIVGHVFRDLLTG